MRVNLKTIKIIKYRQRLFSRRLPEKTTLFSARHQDHNNIFFQNNRENKRLIFGLFHLLLNSNYSKKGDDIYVRFNLHRIAGGNNFKTQSLQKKTVKKYF